jgi:hypothetical protein
VTLKLLFAIHLPSLRVEGSTRDVPVIPCGLEFTIMDIINKTNKPLSIPLPGGKKLFLGPGKTAQLTEKTLDRPALVKLLEAGDIEKTGAAVKHGEGGGGKAGPTGGPRQGGGGAMRQSGDR